MVFAPSYLSLPGGPAVSPGAGERPAPGPALPLTPCRCGYRGDTEPFRGLALCDRTVPSQRSCPAVDNSPASQGLGMSPACKARRLGLQACLSLAGEAGLTLTRSPLGNWGRAEGRSAPGPAPHAAPGLSCRLSRPRR